MHSYKILKRLSNVLRKCGKRTKSDQVIIQTALILKSNGYNDPYNTICEAINILKPMVELRSQKKSGQSVQVPSARTTVRQEGRAIRRLKKASNDRMISNERTTTRSRAKGPFEVIPSHKIIGHSKGFANARANEIMGILRGEGSQALTRRDTLHRMAVAQRGVRRGSLN